MFSQRRLWSDIPEGFEKNSQGRHRWAVRAGLEDVFSAERIIQKCFELSEHRGRAPLQVVKLPDGGNGLVRVYHHGGLLRFVTGQVFCTWPPRPFRELAITVELRRRGIATVEALASGIERVSGPLYTGWFASRELEGARDLWAALRSGWARDQGMDNILRAVAASLQSLHREGVSHGDLNLKNILIRRESDNLKAYVIDFDKASLFLGHVPRRIANGNLARLLRSIRKLDGQRTYLSESDWNQFVRCYRGAGA